MEVFLYNGIINVYKEAGFTSHDVVAKLRGIFGQKKIGHTGTLDPAATGVLPVCLGSGTKLVDMITDRSKTYETVMLLGTTTDTEDTTGMILEVKECVADEEQIRNVINGFIDGYMQIPPMYSALKVDGKKLYELAREGKEIERKPRRVEIASIIIKSIELPYVTMEIDCGKGTYIRSLCRDIGEKLGCGACMASLVRTRVGQFELDKAYSLGRLQQLKEENRLDTVITPVEAMFMDMQAVEVSAEYKKLVDNGNKFPIKAVKNAVQFSKEEQVRVYCMGSFYGIYMLEQAGTHFAPVKIFSLN